MKKYYYLLLGTPFLIALFLTPLQAQAHFLATDGTIGVVMHTDPDDDPLVNAPTKFFFDLKDTTGKFQLKNCNCRATISENGQEVTAKTLSGTDISAASFSFVFAHKGTYSLKLIGSPTQPGAFQTFSLNWDLQIVHDLSQASTAPAAQLLSFLSTHLIGLTLILLAFLFLIYYVMQKFRKKEGDENRYL